MKVFKETQRVNPWWAFLMGLVLFTLLIFAFYEESESDISFQEPVKFLLTLVFSLIPLGIIYFTRLKTQIDKNGVSVVFYPFHFTQKRYSWHEIQKCYVRKYAALTEYGGWGLKLLTSGKAYTISGNYGIQIVTKKGKQFLIGTHQPEKAASTLIDLKDKIKTKIEH